MLGINIIQITQIHPSPMNQRTVFIEESLQELARSIAVQGVIEPIMVRPSKQHEGMYEIVCGERRYRSSIIAQQTTIPAMIRELTDDEALDIMITENLQRRDISPMEEAVAFMQLIDRRKMTIPELATRFGKSELYIRNRLRLNELIPGFRTLIEKDQIPLTHGLELCKLDTKIQQDLYNSHYQADNWNNWNTITSKELIRRINNISIDLKDALFSTLECQKCQFNSRYADLFCDEEKCTNKFCFETKQLKTLTEQAIRYKNESNGENEKCVFFKWSYNTNNPLADSITAAGIPVYDADFYEVEQPPTYPERYTNEADENYNKRLAEYQKRLDRYEKLPEQGYVSAINVCGNSLDPAYYVRQKQNDILCYAMLKNIGEIEYRRILPNLHLDREEKLGADKILQAIKPINEKTRFKITLLFMKITLSNYGLNNQMWRRAEAEVFLRLASTIYPDQTEEIQKIRKGKREKRIAGIDDQINSLKE